MNKKNNYPNNIVSILDRLNAFSDLPKYKECLLEGDFVKLNTKKIKSHPDYAKMRPVYKEFIESNDGVVFTVEYDKNKQDKPNLVCLKEDMSDPKFLFWDGDLLILDQRDGKYKELYMITEEKV